MELLTLFSFCFLAATILPLSSEIIFIYTIQNSTYPFYVLLLVASLGNILGGLTNYFLGYFGNKLFKPKTEGNAFRFAQKYGFVSAFFSWIPIIGDPMLVALGFLKAPFWKVIFLMSVGKVMRYGLLWYFRF